LSPGQIEAFQVAKFYGIDPVTVQNWVNPDFLDAQEFMFIQMELDERELKKGQKGQKG